MIKSFKHKGLEKFYRTGSVAGIQAKHAHRLGQILGRLEVSWQASDMNLPGLYLHPLIGVRQGYWSVRVSGNWRVTFRFKDGYEEVINYEDYH